MPFAIAVSRRLNRAIVSSVMRRLYPDSQQVLGEGFVDENGTPETEFERDWSRQAVALDKFMADVMAELGDIKAEITKIKARLSD